MRGMEKVNIESAKCESLRVRKKKSVPVAKEIQQEEPDEEGKFGLILRVYLCFYLHNLPRYWVDARSY